MKEQERYRKELHKQQLEEAKVVIYLWCSKVHIIVQREKERKAKIPPSEMFRQETDKYSQFDDDGIPTHDTDGNPLTSSQLKKLKKLWQQQNDKYQKRIKY